jgi:quercetin dioxygenase-like cupin family protein
VIQNSQAVHFHVVQILIEDQVKYRPFQFAKSCALLFDQPMKNVPFTFHKTRMTIRVTTPETGGAHSLIEMEHIPNVGPALHVHPRGAESFVVLDGNYTFYWDGEEVSLEKGEGISIPANTPHRYVVGPDGGRLLVVCPPGLENYFWDVSQRLAQGGLTLEQESEIAASFGQDFLDMNSHWGHR